MTSKGLLTRTLLLTRKISRLRQAVVKVAAQWDVNPQVIWGESEHPHEPEHAWSGQHWGLEEQRTV